MLSYNFDIALICGFQLEPIVILATIASKHIAYGTIRLGF